MQRGNSRYLLLFNTIKFLKAKQIYYRIFYFLKNRISKSLKIKPIFFKRACSHPLTLQESLLIRDVYTHKNHFTFLNLSKKFDKEINWNHREFGKLWTYNLTYFDCLTQNNIEVEEKLLLIEHFINNIKEIKDGLEPFPISLRNLNWVKFFILYNINNQKMDESLYAQYYLLLDKLEYHLLGNHLLENGFSLLFGAYYFRDELLYSKAKEILVAQLKEQILNDGGHFELSPMYHQIMLFRLLDCINLVKNNRWKKDDLLAFLLAKAKIMLGWLENISYNNGNIPLFNDSTNGIAPTTKQLFDYAQRLGINRKKVELKESGYRKISKEHYECIVDVGEIGASYIPGHAHADAFNFELYIHDRPFILDMGLSTYETNDRRAIERSTLAHNTVEVNGQNQSQVWGGFRVGNRAKIVKLQEDKNSIEATHDGYVERKNIEHTRKWTFLNNMISIEDYLSSEQKAIARLHFHPSVSKREILEKVKFDSELFLITLYQYSPAFNTYKKAFLLEIEFRKELFVKIEL